MSSRVYICACQTASVAYDRLSAPEQLGVHHVVGLRMEVHYKGKEIPLAHGEEFLLSSFNRGLTEWLKIFYFLGRYSMLFCLVGL